MGLLLDLLPLEQQAKTGGYSGGLRFICAACRTYLDPGETCPRCLRALRDLDDELALLTLGVL